MRADLELIADLVPPNSRLLDLGCGDGELLAHLKESKEVKGYGLDVDPNNIEKCLLKGVNVIEHDLDRGLASFSSDSFQIVVMTETLQSVKEPDQLLSEMLRIGEECIVSFPNFGNWRCRLQLGRGGMPVSKHLPNNWFDTPNIHLCTCSDFERLCNNLKIVILEKKYVNSEHEHNALIQFAPNLLSAYAFYRLGRIQDV
jgi:methionine biosynthesis protein MetW